MSGRHRNDIPDGSPGDGGNDPPRPVFGPANDGSSDWLGARQDQPGPPSPGPPSRGSPEPLTPSAGTGGAGAGAGSGAQPGAGEAGEPAWVVPRPASSPPPPSPSPPAEEPAYGVGGFSGASDAGGHGLGRPAGGHGPAASPMGAPMRSEPPGTGYSEYDSIRSSDGGPSGPAGGASGGHGTGGHGTGGYGSRRRKRRGASALIGPMGGAVGLALLLGAGVYAFAASGGGCTGSDALTLNVAAAPDIQPAIVKAAARFNDAENEADGKCVRASVTKADPASVATLLSGQGVASGSNQRPDVWIPDSSLWTSMVSGSEKGKAAVRTTKTSVASSPIVVGLPRTLSDQLKRQGGTAAPSWDDLLKPPGGKPGGGAVGNSKNVSGWSGPPRSAVRLLVPDPARNGVGMGTLMVTSALLGNDPNRESIFAGIVRSLRGSTMPTVDAQFAQFRKGRSGKQPISMTSEHALWNYNRKGPAEPAVALYPSEGTLSMDYPLAVTSSDRTKGEAARLFERAVSSESTRDDVRALGFRTPDGQAPSGFGAQTGVNPARPRQLPPPKAADVARVMQSWARLSLGLRILTVIDVSGSMAEQVGPNTNRLQAIAQVSQGGLALMSDDTEFGQWLFSTSMQGRQDWRETVSIGPLGERIGSITRRNLALSTLQQMKPKPTGDTGLYDVVLGSYKMMSETYKPEFGNSILLLTDGKNDDADGPSLKETLSRLNEIKDPNKPVQINMVGYGTGVDRNELDQIAKATGGITAVAMTPQEISKIFLQMLSRRSQN